MGEYYGVRRERDDPHLEHIGVPKGWKKPNAKYLARMVTSSGAYRYIYNQAQLAAAKAGKLGRAASNTANSAYRAVRKGVNNAATSAKKSLGVYARRDMNRKFDALRTGNPRSKANANKFDRYMNSRKAYEKTPMGRVESLKNRVVEGAQQTYYQAEKKAKKLGKDAGKFVSSQVNGAQNYVNKKVKQGKKAYKEYQNFKKLPQWQKDLAVAADRSGTKKLMGRNVQGAAMASRLEGIENTIRNATGKAKGAIDDATKGAKKLGKKAVKGAQQLGKNAQGAFNEARRGAQQLGKKASRAVDNVVGVSAKKNMKRQEGRYIKAIESDSYYDLPPNEERRRKTEQRHARIANAERAYSKARRQYYNKTLMGRAEKAGEIGREAVGGAIDAVSNVVKRPKKKRRR